MLSQHIALFMLIENWGIKEDYSQKFTNTLSQFAHNLVELKNNKDNTSAIKKKLESIEQGYKKLILIIYEKNNENEQDFFFSISRLTSQILRKAKKSIKLYVEIKS